MTPNEWFIKFLAQRSLAGPDGRPLYQYRISAAEYRELQNVLSRHISNPHHHPRWDACFVLYASEWWRQNYHEGAWSWEPILDSIRKKMDQTPRSQLVMSGFGRWRRKIYQDAQGHNDYLATVIVECGIPLQILNRENHRLKQLISQTFRTLALTGLSESESPETVAQIAEQLNLPPTLRKRGLYVLVAQIVEEAIKLKRAYQLGQEPSPTGCLDQKKPDWREVFPIQVDTSAGKQFLDELLTEVAFFKEPKPHKIQMIRELVRVNAHWKIKTTLDIPREIYYEDDLGISKETLEKLPSKATIELVSASGARRAIATAYRTSNAAGTGYKIAGGPHALGFDAFKHKWTLWFGQPGDAFAFALPLLGGEPLDEELPWVFVEKAAQWQLKATASVRTNAPEALVVADADWVKSGNVHLTDSFDEKRNVYLLKGECQLSSTDQQFRIVTSQADDDNYSYSLQGNTLNLFSESSEVYLGYPSLYKVNNTTLTKSKCYRKVQVKETGTGWQESRTEPVGSVGIRLLGEANEVLFSRKVSVLPKDFDVTFESISPAKGKIHLKNSSAFRISLLEPNVKGSIASVKDGHEICLESTQAMPPKSIPITLSGAQCGNVTLEVPFPASGAKFFDNNGNQLENRSRQYLDKLYGLRLVLFNPAKTTKVFNLVFQLEDSPTASVRTVKAVKVDTACKEIPLVGFLSLFRKLFSVSENLDAEVRLTVDQGPSISIHRYSSNGLFDPANKTISLPGDQGSLMHTHIRAFRLDKPLDAQVISTLEPLVDNEVHQGKWQMNEIDRQGGKWLLYPAPAQHSSVVFRPRLWVASSEEEYPGALTHICESAGIKDKSARIFQLCQLASSMALDFNNVNWQEVGSLWENTEHLPLNTFDLWTASTKSEEALIGLLLCQDDSLADRISSEYPVLWEAIPVFKWIRIARIFHSHVRGIAMNLADSILESKFAYIESQLKLNCLASILRKEILSKDSDGLLVAAHRPLVKDHINFLFNGGQNTPGLTHRKTRERWPESLTSLLAGAFRGLPADVRELLPPNVSSYMKCVVYLPVLLAARTAAPEVLAVGESDVSEIFALKEIQEFDREWFDAAYDIVQGYYWMNHTQNVNQ